MHLQQTIIAEETQLSNMISIGTPVFMTYIYPQLVYSKFVNILFTF